MNPVVPNLNPAQVARRPMSASLRTPRGGDASFSRLREDDDRATPRLPPKPEAPPGEEEPWRAVGEIVVNRELGIGEIPQPAAAVMASSERTYIFR